MHPYTTPGFFCFPGAGLHPQTEPACHGKVAQEDSIFGNVAHSQHTLVNSLTSTTSYRDRSLPEPPTPTCPLSTCASPSHLLMTPQSIVSGTHSCGGTLRVSCALVQMTGPVRRDALTALNTLVLVDHTHTGLDGNWLSRQAGDQGAWSQQVVHLHSVCWLDVNVHWKGEKVEGGCTVG
jgi:hypothetical protein